VNSFKNSSQKNQRLVSAKSTIELLNIKTKNLGSSKKPGFFSSIMSELVRSKDFSPVTDEDSHSSLRTNLIVVV
jgi:hypothetical protein